VVESTPLLRERRGNSTEGSNPSRSASPLFLSVLPSAAIEPLYDLKVGTTPVAKGIPHNRPHKPLLLRAALDLIDEGLATWSGHPVRSLHEAMNSQEKKIGTSRVESNGRLAPVPLLPLVKPDVRISRIRLSCRYSS